MREVAKTSTIHGVRAFAPGTVANLGPGLDILGLAVTGPGDTVSVERAADSRITIRSSGDPEIPEDPARNTAGIAADQVRRKAGAAGTGLVLEVSKGLPLSGGQGGSAASAVAAAVATNALLGSPLSREDLLEPSLTAEEAVAGRHADNLAAALYGGVVLVRSLRPLDIIALPFSDELLVVLVQPEHRLRTEEARSCLPQAVDRTVALAQAAQVGAFVAALCRRDWDLLRRAVEDRIAEPVRAPLLPGFSDAQKGALRAGALGCSISGSGPAAFAFAVGEDRAAAIAEAMISGYRSRGVTAHARVARIDSQGARVLSEGA